MRRALLLLLLLTACDVETAPVPTGTLQAALTFEDRRDVHEIRFGVLAGAGVACDPDAALVAEAFVDLRARGQRWSGDRAFVLPPATYMVCAWPLTAGRAPSAACTPAGAAAEVRADAPARAALVLECTGDANGALTTAAHLQNAPTVTGLEIEGEPSTCADGEARFTATAHDPNGDAIARFVWAVETLPVGAPEPQLVDEGATARFVATHPGAYELSVVAEDERGGVSAPLRFEALVAP